MGVTILRVCWRHRGKLAATVFLGLALLAGGFFLCRGMVINAGRDRIYTSLEEVKPAKVALVLGCAQRLGDGRENLFFKYRIAAVSSSGRRARSGTSW